MSGPETPGGHVAGGHQSADPNQGGTPPARWEPGAVPPPGQGQPSAPPAAQPGTPPAAAPAAGPPGAPPAGPSSAPPAGRPGGQQPEYSQTQALPLGQQQYSGPPGTGYPATPAGPAPSAARGPWIPLLAGTTAFFLLLTMIMTGLFVATAAQQNETSRKLTSSRSTVSDQREQLEKVTQERDDAKEELAGSENKVGALTDEKEVISQCLTLMFQFIEAAAANNRSQATALADQLREPCNRAQAIVE